MNKQCHTLKIKDNEMKLDEFNLKGVTEYELKSSVAGTTELTLKLIIDSDVFVD